VKLGPQHFDGVVRLSVFAEQQGMTCSNCRIGRYFASASLPVATLWAIFRGAVGIHDHHSRAAILFLAEMPQFFKAINGR